ncbi:glycosyltransferase family 4 protein [Ichthyenterobacterium magnum]|uniref:Glycosyltransferase involved in cell wall biosynthesis n=1 Tax=Ichthyenterobacterium magnum TaxID=1230530 RepID=A0A420DUW3_9FLAO|nr:glycosyltransferase family 4 protein [Ichthyenterobacterium magnum]RKE97969.1 glycosyltransferase involved in cell wall biosynthesis [Ichthyenterobacterium magnum]
MKNVLYIGNRLQNYNRNASYIDVLGLLLEKEGFNVSYASSYTNQILRLLHMLYAVFKLRRKTDFVIIDTYSTLNFYYALGVSQLCRALHLKYIPILHGGNLPSRLKRNSKMSKSIFKKAYINIAPSLYLKTSFEKLGYNNIRYIPNTIEINSFSFKARAYDTPKLLWVRSFSKIYNPKLAVKVLKQLKNKFPDSELCMVGPEIDGSLKTTQKLAKDLELEVDFKGKLTKDEWNKLSNNFNVFINTTNFDNTPLSVIEAMALGLPIVSTNVGGMPFLIDHNIDGILVNPNNASAMSKAIEELFSDQKKCNSMVEKARLKVEKFDWNYIKSEWLKVLSVDASNS